MNAAGTLFALSGVIALVVFATRRMIAKKRERFAGRPNVSPEELQRQFDTTGLSPIEFALFLRQITEATDIPQGKLRPSDRFERELAPVRGWEYDDGLNLLPEMLQEKFGGECRDFDLKRNPTLGELLSAVARVRSGVQRK